MKTKLKQQINYSKNIRIREYLRGDDTRYFTAKICEWNNFKFFSDNMKPQQLLDATLIKCKEIEKEIIQDAKAIETIPSIFNFKGL